VLLIADALIGATNSGSLAEGLAGAINENGGIPMLWCKSKKG